MSRIGGVFPVTSKTNVSAIPVAGEVTVYTRSFDLRKGGYFGVWALASSAGTPNIKIELELAPTAPTEAQEGVAATTLFAIKESDVIFAAINDKVAHVVASAPVPMSFGRYKLTGLTANPADATIQIKNFQQDEV